MFCISIFYPYTISIKLQGKNSKNLWYVGNLNDQLIADVRAGKYDVVEGVVCKGTQRTGAHRGGTWMSKIKTQAYLDKLFNRYGEEGIQKYGE